MAKLDPPQLRTGGLSGRVYVITHGRYLDGGKTLKATRKYDVTDQFDALAEERGWHHPGDSESGEDERWSGVANIAWCPEHGLHGARTHCFECGKPVEQIPMVPVAEIRSGSGEEQ